VKLDFISDEPLFKMIPIKPKQSKVVATVKTIASVKGSQYCIMYSNNNVILYYYITGKALAMQEIDHNNDQAIVSVVQAEKDIYVLTNRNKVYKYLGTAVGKLE
jgi:hypothetical protein